ncbi:MAG TPA: DUF1003 domain-containing protein [Terrimesophilobacter sp.]|nr:DUF1003 domain-containing protein [Terrimesophilobacter sp.]
MTDTIIKNWHTEHRESLTRGQRAADVMRNSMGSWTFVGSFVLFMAAWAFVNSTLPRGAWDPYPYILLNLFLSMLAGLQGAILLIAAKRQDAIAAALAQHDYDTNISAKADIEALLEINNRQVEMLRGLQQLLDRQRPADDSVQESS